jgi:hypothetical protein
MDHLNTELVRYSDVHCRSFYTTSRNKFQVKMASANLVKASKQNSSLLLVLIVPVDQLKVEPGLNCSEKLSLEIQVLRSSSNQIFEQGKVRTREVKRG